MNKLRRGVFIVVSAAGSNDGKDYSLDGWMDTAGYDYNAEAKSKKGASYKSNKSKKSKMSKKGKKRRCSPKVKVGRAVIAGGHAAHPSGHCRYFSR